MSAVLRLALGSGSTQTRLARAALRFRVPPGEDAVV